MTTEIECVHHWIIATPRDGVPSPATCKRCGAERTFQNGQRSRSMNGRCPDCNGTRLSKKHKIDCVKKVPNKKAPV